MVSLGGAIGSALVGLVAPLVLPAYFELAFGLVVCAALLVFQVRHMHQVFPVLAGVVLLFCHRRCGLGEFTASTRSTIMATRNFYGVLRVQEWDQGTANYHRSLIHGTILHGTQYPSPELEREPTTYYTRTSGIGRAHRVTAPDVAPDQGRHHRPRHRHHCHLRQQGRRLPLLRHQSSRRRHRAGREFSYLGNSEATIEIALGDARLSMEREAPQGFDVLAIDAFSSDAIPVHLITREALAIYQRHMKPGGIIAFHVTNRYLDLAPVVQQLATEAGLHAVLVADDGDEPLASRSDWVLLSESEAVLAKDPIAEASEPVAAHPEWRLWTDDFNNVAAGP